jgi:hypothetical protein
VGAVRCLVLVAVMLSWGACTTDVDLAANHATPSTTLARADAPPVTARVDRASTSKTICAAAGERASVVNVPRSIDSTGTVDVTAPLTAWLQSLPPDTEARLKPGGTYRAEHPIVLTDRQSLTINGNRALLLRTLKGDPADPTTRTNAQLRLTRGADLVIRDLRIQGAHEGREDVPQYQVDYEAQHGVDVHGTEGVTLCTLDVRKVLGDFVYVGYSDPVVLQAGVAASNVHVFDNLFNFSGRQGVAAVAVHGLVVERNTLIDVGRTALVVEPVTAALDSDGIVFDANKIVSTPRFVASLGAPADVDGLTITNNTLQASAMGISIVGNTGLLVANKRNVMIANNTSDQPCGCDRLIWLRGIDNASVIGNTAPLGGRGLASALVVFDVDGLVVLDNTWLL